MIKKSIGTSFAAAAMIALTLTSAAALDPGEYACIGSGGSILIGLGFRLGPNGTYTDLDRTTSGRIVAQGSTISFVGGHLDGQTGRNVRGNTFNIGAISCSRM